MFYLIDDFERKNLNEPFMSFLIRDAVDLSFG